jgi:hypothetical protein
VRATWPFGVVLLIAAFLVFLLYGNIASGIVLLALGVVFVVVGGKKGAGAKATTEA